MCAEDRKFVMEVLDKLEVYESEHPIDSDESGEDEEEDSDLG